MATKQELDHLGHSIAHDAACSILASNCNLYSPALPDSTWHDTSAEGVDASAAEEVKDALSYLTMRGLVDRHPEHPDWVSLRDEGEAQDVVFEPMPLDAAGKVFFENPDILVIDGVRVSMEALVVCVHPEPGMVFAAERKGDMVYITRHDSQHCIAETNRLCGQFYLRNYAHGTREVAR